MFWSSDMSGAGGGTNTTKDVKRFLFHPREWVVALVLLIGCTIGRIMIAQSENSTSVENHGPLLANVNSISEAWEKMRTDYCKADVEILCGSKPPPQTGGCFAVYGNTISRLWKMQTAAGETYECSLKGQVHRLDDLIPRPLYSNVAFENWEAVEPPNPTAENLEPEDAKLLVKSIMYFIMFMYQDAMTYLPDATFSIHHPNSQHARDERLRMVYFQLENIIRVFQSGNFRSYGEMRGSTDDETAESSRSNNNNNNRILSSAYLDGTKREIVYPMSSSKGMHTGTSSYGSASYLDMRSFGNASYDKARPRLSTRTLLYYMRRAYNLLQQTGGGGSKRNSQKEEDPFYAQHLPMVRNSIDKILADLDQEEKEAAKRAQETPSAFVRVEEHHMRKFSYSLFGDYRINACIYKHVDREGSVITNLCELAIDQLPHKLNELEMETGGDFLVVTHVFLFGANLACLLALCNLFSARRRMVEKLDKGKKRLEQELTDPVLRQALENKARSLPNPQEFIAKLEAKVQNWDSNAAANKLVKRRLRLFRILLIVTFLATTIGFVGFVSSGGGAVAWARYLEATIMTSGMFAFSYLVSIDNPIKRNARDVLSAIEIGTLDPATTQSLLANNTNEASTANNDDGNSNAPAESASV